MSSHSPRFLTDPQLLAQSRQDNYRGSGPGGQKRNKTSNAVRLVHQPTGLTVTATEARSLKENQTRALHRLRLKIAIELREPITLQTFEPPDWFLTIRHENHLECSTHNRFYAPAIGLTLDLLAALSGQLAAVATMLAISTTAIVKLLESNPHAWTAANQIRKAANLHPLTPR